MAVLAREFAPRRILLIVNPASRRGKRLERVVREELRAAHVEYDAVVTTHAGHATEIIKTHVLANAHNDSEDRPESYVYDAVLTLGGDGTAMEVLTALSPNKLPVGVLPGGTGNLLARALGIPLGIRRAVRALIHGQITRIDLGCFGPRRFAVALGIGIDAEMVAETPVVWKRRLGVAAYVIWGARVVFRQDRFDVKITVDGRTIERRASAVLIANFGAVLSNLITLGDGIAYDDGILDVCIFDPESILDAFRIMWKLVFRDFRPDPAIGYLAGRHIMVSTDRPRRAQADGDLIGKTPLDVGVVPLAGCVLVPSRSINRL